MQRLTALRRGVCRLSRGRARSVLAALAFLYCQPHLLAQEPQTFVVDPRASQVRIELGRAGLFSFLGHDHLIEAPLTEGRVAFLASDVARSRVLLRFEAASLSVVPGTEPAEDIPQVEQRMRGPDVLDVGRYPSIGFTSTGVTGRADRPGTYRLTVRGLFELVGRAYDVSVPVAVRVEGDTLTAAGEVELRLRDLGIPPPAVAGVVKVDNRFKVTFNMKARSAPHGAAQDGGAR